MASERLSPQDATFLHLEDAGAYMHVASLLLFAGESPTQDELRAHVETRLPLVPRFRQKLGFVPFGQGRPVWIDDPHLNLDYHVRATALPPPGSEDQLKTLAGRVVSQRLDRNKPLWELCLIQGLEGDGFGLLAKSHHCLVDGVSGVDITTVLFDLEPEPAARAAAGAAWLPRPQPSRAQLLGDALIERAVDPREIVNGLRKALGTPRDYVVRVGDALAGIGAVAKAGFSPAPHTALNVQIGAHRRFAWSRAQLATFKAIKDALGGSVNDVVLAVVTGGLRSFLERRGEGVAGLELKAMVPVSVRAEPERGALGNHVAAMMAPLPVYEEDPAQRLRIIRAAMAGLKESKQAVGAQVLTELTGFANPTILGQAARLQARQRFFNVVVTNVPGPQFPLYLLGREMVDLFPIAPLSKNQAVAIAVMSYNGLLNFGLLGDYDAMHDLEALASDLDAATGELARAAAVGRSRTRAPRRPGKAPV